MDSDNQNVNFYGNIESEENISIRFDQTSGNHDLF